MFWKSRIARTSLFFIGCVPAFALCLPGRALDPDSLATDYARALRLFRGARYVWGGESRLGIDCSGLVRRGLIWGQLWHGLRTLNGRPIRNSVGLWWYDASAIALRDGYRGWTTELFRHKNVSSADHAMLRPGDLAVTADGVHVMAYLGNRTWIEADPKASKVIEVSLPTDNEWFWTSVVFVRWTWLAPHESPNQTVERTAAPLGRDEVADNWTFLGFGGRLRRAAVAHLGRSA